MTLEKEQALMKQLPTNKAHLSRNYTKELEKASSKSLAAFSLQMIELNTSSGSLPGLLYETNIALVPDNG